MQRSTTPVGVDLLGKRKKFAVSLEKLQVFVTYSGCSALCSPMCLDYMHPIGKSVGLSNLGGKIRGS